MVYALEVFNNYLVNWIKKQYPSLQLKFMLMFIISVNNVHIWLKFGNPFEIFYVIKNEEKMKRY